MTFHFATHNFYFLTCKFNIVSKWILQFLIFAINICKLVLEKLWIKFLWGAIHIYILKRLAYTHTHTQLERERERKKERFCLCIQFVIIFHTKVIQFYRTKKWKTRNTRKLFCDAAERRQSDIYVPGLFEDNCYTSRVYRRPGGGEVLSKGRSFFRGVGKPISRRLQVPEPSSPSRRESNAARIHV